MFENMTKLEKGKELKYRFAQINGVFCNHKWDLNTYVNKVTIYKHIIKVEFINKFYLSFDVIKKLEKEFPTCNLRIESDSDRLILVIEH